MYLILVSHSSECKKEKSVNVEISHNKITVEDIQLIDLKVKIIEWEFMKFFGAIF